MHPDHVALEAALTRHIAALAPVARHLREGVVHPPVAPHEWSGSAARAYRDAEDELRGRLRDAAEAAEGALHAGRLALSRLATLDRAAAQSLAAQPVGALPLGVIRG